MAVKYEKIQVGDVLYERRRYKMGNTTISSIGEWPVLIKSLDSVKRTAVVSWNGNSNETWCADRLAKLFDWSMRDKTQAEVTHGMLGAVTKVRRLRSPKSGTSGAST